MPSGIIWGEGGMGIRQLARELGLSIGTVSRALNDRPDVAPQTRARVKEAAARLGYVPDQSGRSLRTGRTGIVAGVIAAPGPVSGGEIFLLRVFEGTRLRLLEAGIDLVLMLRGEHEAALGHVERLVGRHIADGFLLTRVEPEDARVAFLAARGIPHVTLGRSRGLDPAAWVDPDVEGAAARAVDLLHAAGHRRMLLLLRDGPMTYLGLMDRAFRARAARHGLEGEAAAVLRVSDAGLRDTDRAALAALDPDAVLAADDGIAGIAYESLARLGRAVGREVSVICLLPAPNAEALRPRLSHFHGDLAGMGGELADRLLVRLSQPARPLPPSRPFPLTFVPRESHRSLPAGAAVR
jgi:DNA-binding LacI/PurR family transcriptional regulator